MQVPAGSKLSYPALLLFPLIPLILVLPLTCSLRSWARQFHSGHPKLKLGIQCSRESILRVTWQDCKPVHPGLNKCKDWELVEPAWTMCF